MISGLDLTATVDYTLKDDKDNPTVWRLGILSTYLLAKISSESQNNQIDTIYKILQIAIRGWDNFDIPFETKKEKMFGREMDVVPMATLERVPLNIITELSIKVMEINKLTEGERKN